MAIRLFALFLTVLASAAGCAAPPSDGIHAEYPFVLKENGVYRMWYSGYGSNPKGIEGWRIHYATSPDGVHWVKQGVVFHRGERGSWEESGVAFPEIVKRGDTYMMWYGGNRNGKYAIGLATSKDGIHWDRYAGNPVLTPDQAHHWERDAVMSPSVIYDAARKQFLLWYNGFGNGFGGMSYGIGFATSKDGIHWTKYAANPVLSPGDSASWDHKALYTLSVLKDGRDYKLWYAVGLNGHGGSLGLATSRDGVHWTKSAANPFTLQPVDNRDAWNAYGEFYYGPTVMRDGDLLKMWVNGIAGANAPYGEIGYATSTDGVKWRKYDDNPVLCPGGEVQAQ